MPILCQPLSQPHGVPGWSPGFTAGFMCMGRRALHARPPHTHTPTSTHAHMHTSTGCNHVHASNQGCFQATGSQPHTVATWLYPLQGRSGSGPPLCPPRSGTGPSCWQDLENADVVDQRLNKGGPGRAVSRARVLAQQLGTGPHVASPSQKRSEAPTGCSRQVGGREERAQAEPQGRPTAWGKPGGPWLGVGGGWLMNI